MSQYVILTDIHGTQYKFLADDDGIIQQSFNGTDQQGIIAGSAVIGANAVDTAAIQDLAVTTGKLAAEGVTVGKMADMAAAGVLGATAAGNMAQLTTEQLTALLNAATASLQGAMSATSYSRSVNLSPRRGPDITGNVTIDPIGDGYSQYVVTSLSANCTVTVTNAAGVASDRRVVDIIRRDRGNFTLEIQNSTPTVLYASTTSPANPTVDRAFKIFSSSSIWNANTIYNLVDP